ncbi:hypothetical protein [Umezawaea sp. Da 62-37]|uniref:hypothetical protein n=1 Tax=Umezawaea sp. Da 62-37 TaxID=3075927 RepID=UPI0028F6F1AD|nr:hypothetical protein [Umezawaea sp. Da 62-37]WNV82650.1 hypothetical protein RM788_31190 [Umezawaea sp. Da 62-37]
MRGRVVAVVLAVVVGGCGASVPDGPAPVVFTKVELPAGTAPVVLAADGDALLIGARRDGGEVVPALLRRGADGTVADVPLTAATPYGMLATWSSLAVDGDRVLAIGGERGGAHGNVRWSAWTGTTAGIAEKAQGFSVFGGWGAGELNDAVLTSSGPLLIGTWQSLRVGSDVAVWTADGDTWVRNSSAGTALENTPDSLGFPLAATTTGPGVLVAGWRLAGGKQEPAVWRSTAGNTGWSAAALPDAGNTGAAVAVRCHDGACGVSGWVDGKLAVWEVTDGAATRLSGVPPIAVGDRDPLAAPIDVDGRLTQFVADGDGVRVLRADGAGWTVRGASGPSGPVTAVARVGDAVYLVAGADENARTLWRVSTAELR